MSRKAWEGLRLIESGMSLDTESCLITTTYPIVKDPSVLTDNYNQAVAIQTRIEKGVIRSGKLDEYNENYHQMLIQGCIREIPEEELDSWKGGVNYISHHGVVKETSNTTPLRIMSNLSLINNKSSYSYKSLLAKRPNSISPLLSVLTIFRSYARIVCWDLSKA